MTVVVALRKLELNAPGPFAVLTDPAIPPPPPLVVGPRLVLAPLFRGAASCPLLPLPPRTRADAGYAFGEVVEALGMV